MNRNGFTLVEMLVALCIFALLAVAGVGVLRSSVDVQGSVADRLTAIGGVARLHAMFSSDLGQTVDRPSRSTGGERPAFVGDAQSVEFVSAGHANFDGAPRSDLQRIEWRIEGGTLRRIGFAAVDGGDEAIASPLARDVASAQFRYRMLDGSWNSSFTSTAEQTLPAAVELTITPSGGRPIVMVFAVPPGLAYPVVKEQVPASQPMADQPPSEQGA